MPIYVYEVVLADDSGGEQFEWLQSMKAEPLTTHPETGEPVRRVIGVPNAPRGWTDSQGKAKTSDKKLENLGFTKYVKGETGYTKQFGKGPGGINPPGM